MEKELTYLTTEGSTVFTSKFLKNKGTCCKSGCLHCPYGYTLKKYGIEFEKATQEDFILIDEIMKESQAKLIEWKSFLPENIYLIKLKSVTCGFFLKNHIVIKHVFLKPHFQSQGLSKEIIESYFYI